jgi:hypothetical protein
VKIAVCIKRVPEMDVRFKIAPSGTGVDEAGLKWDMSDFDGYAVEAALQMTEKLGAGEVVVITLGPDAAQETLRKALSMGAARAVHLKADPIPFDNFAIAKALAAELQGGGYDLVMFGKMYIDSSNGAVGPITAEDVANPVHRDMFRKAKVLGVDACPAYGRKLVDEGRLAASVITPANTGEAIRGLKAFWDSGVQFPLKALTHPAPYPAPRTPAAR